MAGLHAPLPTLRRPPRGCLRTARGRCGSILLHRVGFSPTPRCRSPGGGADADAHLRPSTRVARPPLERGARSASPSPARTDVSGEPRNGQYTPHAQISLASLPTPGERGGTPPDTAYFRPAGAAMALRRPASHQAARKPLRPPLLTPKPSAATQPSIVATKVLSPPHRLVPARPCLHALSMVPSGPVSPPVVRSEFLSLPIPGTHG